MARRNSVMEKRESRISLLVKASTYENIAILADSQNLSLNEFCTRLIEKAINKNAQVIEDFKKARDSAANSFVDVDESDIKIAAD